MFHLDEMISFFSDDATAFFPVEHNVLRIQGKETIRKVFAKVINRMKSSGMTRIKLDAEDVYVQMLSDIAIVTFHIRDTSLSRRTLVLQYGNGEWKIKHLHASNASLVFKTVEA